MSNKMIYLLGLPKIENIYDLSNHIYISEYTLNKISFSPNLFYKEINLLKKNGKPRKIASPSKKLKAIQAWIMRNILYRIPSNDSGTAFKQGKNIKDNVLIHQGNSFFLCMDIEDFFPSIKKVNVYNFFKSLGYNEHVSMLLTNYCTYKGGLPQGGVTSPALSNLLNIRLDRRISSYVGSRNIKYSRYADDITLSSNNPDKLIKLKKMIEKIITDEGYIINESKTRFLRPGTSRKITGLIYGEQQEIRIGNKQKRHLRSCIHHLENKNMPIDDYIELKKYVDGWLSFLKSVDIKTYQQLTTYHEQLVIKLSTMQVASDEDQDDFNF